MEYEANQRIRNGDKMTGVLLICPGAGHGEAIRASPQRILASSSLFQQPLSFLETSPLVT
jgi:hypothetical protein